MKQYEDDHTLKWKNCLVEESIVISGNVLRRKVPAGSHNSIHQGLALSRAPFSPKDYTHVRTFNLLTAVIGVVFVSCEFQVRKVKNISMCEVKRVDWSPRWVRSQVWVRTQTSLFALKPWGSAALPLSLRVPVYKPGWVQPFSERCEE